MQEMSYNEAYKALEKLVAQIEDDTIKLDELADKVKAANELIGYCEQKLRSIEGDVKAQVG